MKIAAISSSLFVLMLVQSAFAQTLPSKIRGYKVYDAKVVVTNKTDAGYKETDADAAVKLTNFNLASVGLGGVIVEVGADIMSASKSGDVEFMAFHDFRVNGVAINVEEYKHPFSFKKAESLSLPQPARITIKPTSLVKGAAKELTDPKKDWIVTGTVFVFGKFKKFGFSFKRVVPVKIDIKIKNLLQ
ncbi:MAG: hypothetical protein IPK98_15255 [Chloracidobacterium sp.]|nr:hypothetical protein [Chloracidobacterium sp.]